MQQGEHEAGPQRPRQERIADMRAHPGCEQEKGHRAGGKVQFCQSPIEQGQRQQAQVGAEDEGEKQPRLLRNSRDVEQVKGEGE